MKNQWKSITSDQEERFSAFRERKTQIEKDVNRTDRTHPFFSGDVNKNVDLLQDILMTYIMHDFDLGYVQVHKILLYWKHHLILGSYISGKYCISARSCHLIIIIAGNVRFTITYSLRNGK